MQRNYEWTRFWCPSDNDYYIDQKGYLIDPESELSPNSHLIVNPMKRKEKCIIFLGEPGIGKTVAMEKYQKTLIKNLKESSDEVLFVNLQHIGYETSFKSEIFENRVFKRWQNGSHNLYLLLDSFDECYLRASVIARLLTDYLQHYPCGRLYLRIACRTGYWPGGLQMKLNELYRMDDVQLFELVPIRRKDVEIAVNSTIEKLDGKSPSDFIDKIEKLEVVPFAVRPITLQALINHYNRHGTLPTTKVNIYHSNCLRMCKEIDPLRQKESLACEYSPEQRYIVACRNAALCLFTKHKGIWTAIDMEDIQEGYLPKSILRQGQETIHGKEFDVTDTCIDETLACGLFTSSDPRREWSHWSFLEYLAAYYLIHKKVPLIQILSLIENPFDPQRKIVPQLRGVVSWLCSMNEDLLEVILNKEPEVLLRSDRNLFTKELKEKIVSYLLENYDTSSLRINVFGFIPYFKKLCYPKLENQIRTFILQPDRSWESKRFAIKLAEECGFLSLSSDFIKLIVNEYENIQVRITAARTLKSFSQSIEINELKKLIPIALSDEPIDNDYFDLKGLCLIILWPNYIDPDDLFDHLPEPNLGHIGSYSRFILGNFIEGLSETGIKRALSWIQENLIAIPTFSLFRRMIDLILSHALSFDNNKDIFEALSDTICALLLNENYLRERNIEDSNFQIKLIENQDIRRVLLRKVLQKIPNEERILYQLLANFFNLKIHNYGESLQTQTRLFELLEPEDLNWLIDELGNSEEEAYQQKIAFLINRMFPRDLDHFDKGYELYRKYPVLHQYFIFWFGPIKLESENAIRMKKEFEIMQGLEKIEDLEKIKEKLPKIEPPPSERIKILLNQFEKGNNDAWWYLNMLMTLEKNSKRYGNCLNPDLTSLPGWINSSEEIHIKIIEAAKSYIINGEPNTDSWLGTNTIHRPAYAGYRAIRLLYEIDPYFINNLPPDIWKKWISIILIFIIESYDNQNTQEEKKIRSEILEKAYPDAKAELIKALAAEIDYENENGQWLSVIQIIENIWNDDIAELLHKKALEKKLKPEIRGDLFDTLLHHKFPQTREFISTLLLDPVSETDEDRILSIRAAKALMLHSSDGGWDIIFRLIQSNPDWSRELIEHVFEEDRFSYKLFEQYSESQLADLYIWLVNQYPYETDRPFYGQPRFQSRDDSVRELRDHLLRFLETKGSFESVNAIQKIIMVLPQMKDNLSYRLLRAQEMARRRTWEPPSPQEIYYLFQNSASRSVQSGVQLLELLIESFDRLEDKLQGRGFHPNARDVWDRQKEGTFRPYYENEFSDYVKNHLIDDLTQDIVIHREVEIDPINKTDILVTLINPDAKSYQDSKISALIEVKGSWHREIKKAMQNQLFERYMRPRASFYGIYLVGWFRSPYWDPTDNRSSRNTRIFPSISDLINFLEDQAQRLSEGDFLIKSKVINVSLTKIHRKRYQKSDNSKNN